jgi:HEAT repeat protein
VATAHDLVRRLNSPDPNARSLALAELVGQGRAATGSLIGAFAAEGGRTRELAAQALAEIADPASAEVLVAALADGNPKVRGRAAQGLARIGDPLAAEYLAQTINDLPDVLHHPFTVATYLLIELGRPALAAVAPLLRSDDPVTRQRALLVVRSVVSDPPAAGDELVSRLAEFDLLADGPADEATVQHLIELRHSGTDQ